MREAFFRRRPSRRFGDATLAGVALIVGTVAMGDARAVEPPFGECRAGWWSSNRDLDDRDGIAKADCLIQWRGDAGEHLRFGLSGRLGSRHTGAATDADAELREAFAEFDRGRWTLRAGRQIVAWGRADKINPTDSFSTRDYTLLASDDDEQRRGSDALSLRLDLGGSTSLTGVVADDAPHRLPEGPLPKPLRRDDEPQRLDRGLRLDRVGERFDWSLSWFDGYDRMPRYRLAALSPRPALAVGYERVQVAGADFATAAGRWSFRGEAAYVRKEARSDALRAVLGLDTDLGDTANLNLQWVYAARADYRDPDTLPASFRPVASALNTLNREFRPREQSLTLRLTQRLRNERLKLEWAGAFSLDDGSGVLRPRLTYQIDDRFKVVVGADRAYGRDDTVFGSRRDNDLVFAELGFVF